jgi:hypothetical protein
MKTMKIAAFLLSAIALTTCVTQRRCFEKFPPQVGTIVEYDTIVEYRVDTIELKIQGDTVYAIDTLYVDVQGKPYSHGVIRADAEYAYSTAWAIGGKMYLQLIQKDTLIRQERDSMIASVNYYKTLYETSVITNNVKKIPLIYRVLPFIVIILCLLLILMLLFRRC